MGYSTQVGAGFEKGESLASPVKVLEQVRSIDAGESHVMATKSDRSVWAWGNNAYGTLGIGTTGYVNYAPLRVSYIESNVN